METMRPPEKKIDGSSVTGMEMTSSSLSALVARLRVRGGDRGAARRGWLRPVCGCAAGPVAARGVCAARPGRREHERGDRRLQRLEARRGRGRRGWEAWFGTSAVQALRGPSPDRANRKAEQSLSLG